MATIDALIAREILDMPLNTVRVYIHRGRRQLREKLSGRYESVAMA